MLIILGASGGPDNAIINATPDLVKKLIADIDQFTRWKAEDPNLYAFERFDHTPEFYENNDELMSIAGDGEWEVVDENDLEEGMPTDDFYFQADAVRIHVSESVQWRGYHKHGEDGTQFSTTPLGRADLERILEEMGVPA